MPHRDLLTRVDIAKWEIIQIQQNLKKDDVPLPSGWWWNGNAYIDHVGTQKLIRPDIEPYVELYITAQNAKIAEYNELLDSVHDLL